MAIYVIGDTHGSLDLNRLSHKKWPLGRTLTKQDQVIILGDFGLVWQDPPSNDEIYWLKWLQDAPWTTLFVDGNHENHELLAQLQNLEMFGGVLGIVRDSIYHLRRGQIYTIDGKRIFTFGGAVSTDKEVRTIGKSWWPGECPSYTEMNTGLKNLEQCQYKVDYILAHTAPKHAANALLTYLSAMEGVPPMLLNDGKERDPTCDYLQRVADSTEYCMLYCGHWHADWQFQKTCFVYQEVHKLL